MPVKLVPPLKQGFARMSMSLLERTGTHAAALILTACAQRTIIGMRLRVEGSDVWTAMTYKQIEQLTGVTLQTAQRAITRCEAQGLLRRRTFRNKKNGHRELHVCLDAEVLQLYRLDLAWESQCRP